MYCLQSNQQEINFQNIQTAYVALCQKNKQPNQKMGRRSKQTFLQRRQTDGQKPHEKMLNISNYQKNAKQNYNEVPPHRSEWPSSKGLQTINAGEGVEKRESSYTPGGNAKLVQPLWRTVWRFLKKLKWNHHIILQSHSWAYILRKP